MSDRRWQQKGPNRWVLTNTGFRREVAIIRGNVGLANSPHGCWTGTALGLAFELPEDCREAARLLSELADEWERLGAQHREVAWCRPPEGSDD